MLNIRLGFAFATVILLGSLASATAQGNFVVNGSFDTGVTGWTPFNVGGSGWDAKGNPGGCFYLAGPLPSIPSTISQTINGLTPGTTYLISGDYEGQAFSAPNSSFGVAVNGNYLFTGASTSWQSFSFLYTTASSSADFSLSSSFNGAAIDYKVDNISLTAVPEPSSLCLVGMGGVVGLFVLRRKAAQVCG